MSSPRGPVQWRPAGCGCSWLRSRSSPFVSATGTMSLQVTAAPEAVGRLPVKLSAQPTLVRTQHLPPPPEAALDHRIRGSGCSDLVRQCADEIALCGWRCRVRAEDLATNT